MLEIQKSPKEQNWLAEIRDAFNAGYQFPQYCIDNNIKSPLIVGVDDAHIPFLWEIYSQIYYDKRNKSLINPSFAIFIGKKQLISLSSIQSLIPPLQVEIFSETDINNHDKIIFLGINKIILKNNKFVFLNQLRDYFFRQAIFVIPLLSFLKKHPGVKLITMHNPVLRENEHNTENEKKVLATHASATALAERMKQALIKGETFPTPYDFLGYSFEDTYALLTFPGVKIDSEGIPHLIDNDFRNIHGGKRSTANQPEHYKNTIYIIDHCVYYGTGVPWDKTVASVLQNILNKHKLSYRVENLSQGHFRRFQDSYYILNSIEPKPNDIIFFWIPSGVGVSNSLPFFDVYNIFKRPHNYGEIFPDATHINEIGHKVLAEKFFDYLTENNFFQDVEFNYPPPHCPLIVMAFRKNLFQARQIFCKIRSLKNTKINSAKKDCQSAA